jgi:hypothetical protein
MKVTRQPRVWSQPEAKAGVSRRRRRSTIDAPDIRFESRSVGTPYSLAENPGIEFWHFSLTVDFDRWGRREGSYDARIASASLCRVNTNLCLEIGYELDNISYDLGMIGSAVEECEQKLSDWSVRGGGNGDFVIAQDVVVDGYWRGGRLGPSLTLLATDLLRADTLFLVPAALRTRLNPLGICRSCYDPPRPGPEAQKKVEKAWRSAGLRILKDGVVWSPLSDSRVTKARLRIERINDDIDIAKAHNWWRRKRARALSHVS